MRLDRDRVFNLLARLFFLWVIYQFALGGWDTGWRILTQVGLPAWVALMLVCALTVYKSDWHVDVPLFIAAYALGYWGEWWGTTRGVWTYSNGQMPPDYLPPLWAIGLLTVTHWRALVFGRRQTPMHAERLFSSASVRAHPRSIFQWLKIGLLVALPVLTFIISAPRLLAVDWTGRLDAHFSAGILIGILLIAYRFDLDETFTLYVSGMLLGGTYEWLGTTIGEWTYITGEVPPLWIMPLWGFACVAMVKLARIVSRPFFARSTK